MLVKAQVGPAPFLQESSLFHPELGIVVGTVTGYEGR